MWNQRDAAAMIRKEKPSCRNCLRVTVRNPTTMHSLRIADDASLTTMETAGRYLGGATGPGPFAVHVAAHDGRWPREHPVRIPLVEAAEAQPFGGSVRPTGSAENCSRRRTRANGGLPDPTGTRDSSSDGQRVNVTLLYESTTECCPGRNRRDGGTDHRSGRNAVSRLSPREYRPAAPTDRPTNPPWPLIGIPAASFGAGSPPRIAPTFLSSQCAEIGWAPGILRPAVDASRTPDPCQGSPRRGLPHHASARNTAAQHPITHVKLARGHLPGARS